jgi:Flp pilus assembly protein TadG
MKLMRHMRSAIRAAIADEEGAVTVEFVVILPLVLSIFFLGIDAGIMNLRQVFLDRAVDTTVREVRLGLVSEQASMSDLICQRTAMLPSCLSNIAVEMLPVSTSTFEGLSDPIRCIDREENVTPAVVFNPGAGGQAQELMLLRVCVVSEPFLRVTGMLRGVDVNPEGDVVLISKSIFVNEPRS